MVCSCEPQLSVQDKRVLSHWDETTLLQNGHYEMKIPFEIDPSNLPDNHVVAEKRLQSLVRRLRRDPTLHDGI